MTLSNPEVSAVRPHSRYWEVRQDIAPLDGDDDGAEVKEQDGDADIVAEDLMFEEEQSGEARQPAVVKDPGAPTAQELASHSLTHLPHRSWCQVCVAARSTDRPHRRAEDIGEHSVPEVCFDYAFVKTKDEDETQAVQVARDRQTHMIFAHHVPRKGLASTHGASEMLKDLEKLGYHDVILKCDGEPALVNVQKEVVRLREKPTQKENSPAGDSKANGVSERAVRAFGDQLRAVRGGLELRLGVRIPGKHCITSWMIEHSADLLNKFSVGADGRTAYKRLKGKDYKGAIVEFGERVHHRRNVKGQIATNKLEQRWDEGFYLGADWRSGEAFVGTSHGVVKAGVIRRVGAHRRWDAEGLLGVRGVPWRRTPEAEDEEVTVTMIPMPEREVKRQEVQPGPTVKARRTYLKKEDFFTHGFTNGCPACQMIIAGTTPSQGGNKPHTAACRARMETALAQTDEGQARLHASKERCNQAASKAMGETLGEDLPDAKRTRTCTSAASSSGASGQGGGVHGGQKRVGEQCGDAHLDARPASKASRNQENQNKRECEHPAPTDTKKPRGDTSLSQEGTGKGDDMLGEEMDTLDALGIQHIERSLQEDFTWTISHVDDMCEDVDPDVQRAGTGIEYWDDVHGSRLDPKLVAQAEEDELRRFGKMKVYEYINRKEAEQDPEGIFVKTRWVRTDKGTEEEPKVRARLVAQELAYGERLDELFSGTPSLATVKAAIAHASVHGRGRKLMILDVKCAFLYAPARRRIYVELPSRDKRAGTGVVGRLLKALYGTRDAPQLWAEEVHRFMTSIGFRASALQPAVYSHVDRGLFVVVHVDDFLVSGTQEHLDWFAAHLSAVFDFTKTVLGNKPGDKHQAKYLNRLLRWGTDNKVEYEGDPRHAQLLLKEWGMEHCRPSQVPITKKLMEELGSGGDLPEHEARGVRRAIARLNYMSQDRPDISFAARELSKYMAKPQIGTKSGVAHTIRYLRGHPRCVESWAADFSEDYTVRIWSDADWASDPVSRKSVSGGLMSIGGVQLGHWSKTQATVALSSGESEFNAVIKALQEGIAIANLFEEMLEARPAIVLYTDASACKGMLLRSGVGRLKHLSTKQVWAQGAVAAYQVSVRKIPRAINTADILTHPSGAQGLLNHLHRAGYELRGPDAP